MHFAQLLFLQNESYFWKIRLLKINYNFSCHNVTTTTTMVWLVSLVMRIFLVMTTVFSCSCRNISKTNIEKNKCTEMIFIAFLQFILCNFWSRNFSYRGLNVSSIVGIAVVEIYQKFKKAFFYLCEANGFCKLIISYPAT